MFSTLCSRVLIIIIATHFEKSTPFSKINKLFKIKAIIKPTRRNYTLILNSIIEHLSDILIKTKTPGKTFNA